MNWLALLIYRVKTLASMVGVKDRASWSNLDRHNLQVFLCTQSGQRFIHLIRNAALDVTLQSVWTGGGTDRAKGYQELFKLRQAPLFERPN